MAKVKVEFNPQIHGDRLAECIKQCSDHKAIAEGANEAFAETKNVAIEELGVDSKLFTKLLTMYHKDQREEFEAERDEVIETYDAIFKK